MKIILPSKSPPPITVFDKEQFVTDLESGIIHDKRDVIKNCWRVSSLVSLWDENYGGGKCEKLMYLAYMHGEEKDFESDTIKRFHIGTKVHDIVKEYFEKSTHFKVKHEELPIKHPTLPLYGTMDLVLEWDGMPSREVIVEIKSVESTYFNNPIWGSKIKPFKKARWQAGIYSTIYKAPVIVVYYCKDNSEIVAHWLKEEDYKKDVDEIITMLEKVYRRIKTTSDSVALSTLNGVCKTKCKQSCPLREFCDVGKDKIVK